MKDQSKTKQALIKELVTLRKKITELERPESGASSTKHRQPQHVEGRDKNSTVSSKILVSGINVEWDAKQGTCTFEDLPVAMMWVDTTLAGLMSGVQAMVGTERFFLALQSEGRKGVEADWQVISQHSDFRDGFKVIANIAAVAGWGYWELASFDVNKSECLFRVRDSWEGRYQKSLGVCWGSGMLAGKMAGYCSKLFGTNCWADQTQFIAKGNNHDEFVVKPSPRLIENEIENLLASDEATRADMAVALKKLEKEITERKQVEQVLRNSEELYRNVFENHAAVKLLIDPDTGSIVEANEAAVSYYGWSREQLKQMKIQEINTLSPVDVKKEMKKALTKKQITFDFRHRRADGLIRDVEVFSSKVNMKGKDLLHSIIHDVTERKRAEEALRESEERFKTLFQESMDAQILIDREGKVVDCNDAHIKLFCLRGKSDIIGHSPDEFSSEFQMNGTPSSEMGKKILTTVLEKGSARFEWLHQKHDPAGTLIMTELSLTLLQIANRPMIHVTIRDITDRKRAEDDLRKSEEKYRLTFSSISDIIYTIDSDLRISSVSPNVEKILGYKIEELINRPFMELTLLTPESLEKAISNTMRVLSGEHILAEVYEFIAKDGTRRFGEISDSPLIHEGRIVGLTSVARDITERKLLESQLRQAQKMEAIGTLAGGIAHDFNNILGAILGYTDMALADQKMDDRQRRYLEQVFKAGERARDLVKQILTFSRQREQEKKPVLIAPIIKEGVKMLRSSLPTTVKIIQNIKDESLMVLADPTQIHQVVMNLCTNAAHAMREKGGTLDIEIAHERIESSRTSILGNLDAGDYAKATVSDTGHGIAEAIMDRIFDPFFTTKGPGEGTGLGLSAVYGIVRDHGGAIEVSSESGKGTTFTVYLPLIETKQIIREHLPELISGGSERILFIDDEAALAELGRAMLTSLGYRVTSRTSSIEALEAFRANPHGFDLVITDMTMPNMRGDLLAVELLKIRPDIPIILCTGFSEAITQEKAKTMGIREFIMKPVNQRQIAAVIRRVLDEKK